MVMAMPLAPLPRARQWGYTASPQARRARKPMSNAHDFSFAKLNEPGELRLADYAGKAVLIVNVASACGFTSQYRDLEALYEAKAAKGLVVLGVPCNDFGQQEAGAEKTIREFCDATYHVTFPMSGKVEIIARDRRHPLYAWIADQVGEAALPRWNFHKFLIGKDGALAESFSSKETPLGPTMLAAIDKALSA
jgi:glutathione peroxidase